MKPTNCAVRSLVLSFLIFVLPAPVSWAADLSITPSGEQIVISWPVGGTNDFYVQTTTNLSLPVTWSNATNSVSSDGITFWMTNDIAVINKFYRLQSWETLFDGTSVSAFRGYRLTNFPATNQWLVTTNGELQAVQNASPVALITTKQFGDYELYWEWKTVAGGDSGLLYRANETYTKDTSAGPEYQLLDDLKKPSLPAFDQMGAAYKIAAPVNKVLLPVGEWNACKLLLQGNHVEHWLNGGKIVEYEINSLAWTNAIQSAGGAQGVLGFGQGTSPGQGYIMLLNQNGPTWFRNIKIRQLPAN